MNCQNLWFEIDAARGPSCGSRNVEVSITSLVVSTCFTFPAVFNRIDWLIDVDRWLSHSLWLQMNIEEKANVRSGCLRCHKKLPYVLHLVRQQLHIFEKFEWIELFIVSIKLQHFKLRACYKNYNIPQMYLVRFLRRWLHWTSRYSQQMRHSMAKQRYQLLFV